MGPEATAGGQQVPQPGWLLCAICSHSAPPHGPRKIGASCLLRADSDTSHHGPLGLSKVTLSFSPLCGPGRGIDEVCHLIYGRYHLRITTQRLGHLNLYVSANNETLKWGARLRGDTHSCHDDGQETRSSERFDTVSACPAHGSLCGYDQNMACRQPLGQRCQPSDSRQESPLAGSGELVT